MSSLRRWERAQSTQFVSGVKHVIGWWRKFGVKEGVRRILQTKECTDGVLRGRDQFGNEYYENLSSPVNKQRFIIYGAKARDVDGSQIPPEWHQWMHQITDRTPDEQPPVPGRYIRQHEQMRLSSFGSQANYQPPGAWQRRAPKAHSSYNVWTKESEAAQISDNTGTQPRV